MAMILIVDDDPTVRAIAAELLSVDGHAVVEAADGAEALALVETLPVDLIILDMLMPEVDGLETILALKRRKTSAKVLAMSSGGLLDPTGLLRIAVTFGADAAIQKPLRASHFAAAVNQLLQKEDARAGIAVASR